MGKRHLAVTGVLVTRGDVDLDPILESWDGAFAETIIWRNGDHVARYGPLGLFMDGGELDLETLAPVFPDLSVYGRYEAIRYATSPAVYVQDDDCLVDVAAVLDRYEPGRLVANLPRSRWTDYPDSTMVGWGAVFDRDLPSQAFETYRAFPRPTFARTGERDRQEAIFRRTCDVVFSALTPRTVIDVGFQHLPWAEGSGRMFTTDPTAHKRERDEVLAICRRIRGPVDDDRRG